VRAFEAVPFRPGKPSLVLAKTRKGKGVSFMENVAKWHHGVPNNDEFDRAMAELEAAEAGVGLMELALANLETFATTLLESRRKFSTTTALTARDSRSPVVTSWPNVKRRKEIYL
jgi:transketolase